MDNSSDDATGETAGAAVAITLRHEWNRGKGKARSADFHKARELLPDVIIMLDGDGQHLPEEVPLVLARILEAQADIVSGFRAPCRAARSVCS